MRAATVVFGGGVLLAVSAATVWLVLREDEPARVDDDLPAWFGDAAHPARIAGHVFDARPGMTVHLMPDGPDLSEVRGLTQVVTPSGDFDFGPMRGAHYLVFAEGDGLLSRIVHVDTATGRRVEVFAYERSTIEANVTRSDNHFWDPDWRWADQLARGVPLDLLPERTPIIGTVVRSDGSLADGVGVQPIECPGGCTYQPTGISTVATTDAFGMFVLPRYGEQLCGVRIWNGAQIHELDIEWGQPFPRSIELPALGREQHRSMDYLRLPSDHLGGAWIRGRVIRDGRGIGDVDVSATVVPRDFVNSLDVARTRIDGTFELHVVSRRLYESNTVEIELEHTMLHLAGYQIVRVAPGGTLGDVTIEIGAGLAVSGTVVDESGAPVSGVHVDCNSWSTVPPTGDDGAFHFVIREQGRCRLQARISSNTEIEPMGGVAPKIDVAHPDGELTGIRFVVRRGRTRGECCNHEADVDLGLVRSEDRVVAVADELAAAGLRVGDEILSATRRGREIEPHLMYDAGFAAWGEPITLTVKRGNDTVIIRATAPTFR